MKTSIPRLPVPAMVALITNLSVLSFLMLLARIEFSLAQSCSDGYDDVFSLAMKHWSESGKQIQTQSLALAGRESFGSTCQRCKSCKVPSQYKEAVVDQARIVASNGLPNHTYQVYSAGHWKNPNDACSQPSYMALDLNPTKGSTFTSSGLGPVGLAVTGAFLFNHLSNPSGNDDVAAVQEDTSFDTCMGHSAPGCIYHYHRAPTTGCIPNWNECSLVGWLRDGFPVYSYCRKGNSRSGSFLRTCYEKKNGYDGSSTWHYEFNRARFQSGDCDLDEANGYTFPAADWRGTRGINGYGYVFSEDYPFIMPGYYGSKLHPLVTLAENSQSGTSGRPSRPFGPRPSGPWGSGGASGSSGSGRPWNPPPFGSFGPMGQRPMGPRPMGPSGSSGSERPWNPSFASSGSSGPMGPRPMGPSGSSGFGGAWNPRPSGSSGSMGPMGPRPSSSGSSRPVGPRPGSSGSSGSMGPRPGSSGSARPWSRPSGSSGSVNPRPMGPSGSFWSSGFQRPLNGAAGSSDLSGSMGPGPMGPSGSFGPSGSGRPQNPPPRPFGSSGFMGQRPQSARPWNRPSGSMGPGPMGASHPRPPFPSQPFNPPSQQPAQSSYWSGLMNLFAG